MKRKLLFGMVAAVLVVGGLSLYVGLPIGRELSAAQALLSQSTGHLRSKDIAVAKQHLIQANRHLAGAIPAILRLFPVVRQNIATVDDAVDAGIPALTDAERLTKTLESVEGHDLVVDGRVNLRVIERLEKPLTDQARSLSVLEATLEESESAWLVPPIWDTVEDLAARVEELRASAITSSRLVDISGSLFGADGTRRYLVILVNNAELRGAGGILSGLGTLEANDGALELGDFDYFGDLVDEPPRRVPAPADFVTRFGRYFANSTEWVNVTASPDVPDVALVASRLYELKTGITTDGAIIIDPRGIAALMPRDAELPAPRGLGTISRGELPRFVYSDSYALIDNQDRRRKAVLQLGSAAFREAIEGGLGDRQALGDAAAAVRGQHIRMVSLDRAEQDVLNDAGITGELTPTTNDNVFVSVQNLGADKLDYWMERRVTHRCEVGSDLARCSTEAALTNNTPAGLPAYVVQPKRIYGLYRGYVEVYMPSAAKMTGVELNEGAAEFYEEEEESRTSLGMYFRTRPGETSTVTVSYELPLKQPYALTVTPQPLTRDASLSVQIDGPSGWRITGPGQTARSGTSIRYSGTLDATHQWQSVEHDKHGLSAIWAVLKRFWSKPLF
ncbi:MAG: DUF4012 domain-containing protein [Actinomycetota bacterium]|nr:DUF4012 domain-containing protein [Actinomycetota bacterium]